MGKKIGILTHYYQSKNLGGLLQTYALPAVLTKLGYLAEQLSFDYTFCTDSVKKAGFDVVEVGKFIEQVYLK